MPRTIDIEDVDQEAMRCLALDISLQFPREYEEAMAVLSYLRDIVAWKAGLVVPIAVPKPDAVIQHLRRA